LNKSLKAKTRQPKATCCAQDEEMMTSIERDIALRENKSEHRISPIKIRHQAARHYGETNRIVRKASQHTKREQQGLLLDLTA
jgi:hypothetical protein